MTYNRLASSELRRDHHCAVLSTSDASLVNLNVLNRASERNVS